MNQRLNSSVIGWLLILARLTRLKVTAAVAVTTLAGYLLVDGRWEWEAAWAILGIFLMAAGSSALNQVQEVTVRVQLDRAHGGGQEHSHKEGAPRDRGAPAGDRGNPRCPPAAI